MITKHNTAHQKNKTNQVNQPSVIRHRPRQVAQFRLFFFFFPFSFFFLLFSFFFSGCNFPKSVNVNIDENPFQKLSEYYFFRGEMKKLSPNENVLPYDLITPLFSDYAEKARFVYMPPNSSATYNDTDIFYFPEGTVLIKNFYYSEDFRKVLSFGEDLGEVKIIETRLLVKRKDGWDALPYIWNGEQTEAFLEVAGGNKKVNFIDKTGNKIEFEYSIPNKNQCKSCHTSGGKFQPIGLKARNLNRNFPYSEGEKNQLFKWSEISFLKKFSSPENAPRIANWDDEKSGTLQERALAYLEVNCAHCHSPNSPAATSGLHLTTTETNRSNLGICKSSVAAGKGTGGLMYDIVPGKPNESILFYRMVSLDPGVMMPELGRKLVHKEGVELMRLWIESLNGNCSSQ